MIKAGLIGCGYAAKTFHVPLLEASRQIELTAISTSRPDVVRARFPGAEIYDSAAEMIRSAKIDLVVVTAPNDVHYRLAVTSLEKGLHVVVEKPMVTSSSEGSSLVALAQRKSKVLSVFQNRRWDGDFLTVKDLIARNAVGDVRFFESHFDRFRPEVKKRWREMPGAGTGLWWDLGPHLIDQSLCLFGKPDAVTAVNRPMRHNAEVTDYFHVLLHYAELEVVLHGSPFVAAPNRRFQLQGTAGSYVKDGLDPQEAQLAKGMRPHEPGYGVESPDCFGTLYEESGSDTIETHAGCYQRYYEGISLAIQDGAEPPVRAEDIIGVMEILELAETSQRDGRTIDLPSTETL